MNAEILGDGGRNPQRKRPRDEEAQTDIRQRQKFIRQVIGKFIEHRQIHGALFVITYDERRILRPRTAAGTPDAAQFCDPSPTMGSTKSSVDSFSRAHG